MSSYKKLVRDKIPDIISSNGEKPVTRILADDEYKEELRKKLQEECLEVINATTSEDIIEELADVLEVIRAYSQSIGKDFNDVVKAADIKKTKRGGFNKKIYLEEVNKIN